MLVLIAVVLGLSASAQDPVRVFRNDVKLSMQPLLSACPIVSYERALPHRQSVELTVGCHLKFPFIEEAAFTSPFDGVALAQVGYKYTFAHRGSGASPTSGEGDLSDGWYVKAFVGANRFWRSLDCFVGNQGQEIFTERRTFHATTLSIGTVGGWQMVLDNGLVIDIFMGLSIPRWYYGPVSWREYCQMNYTYSSLLGLTQGVRLGWSF